MMTITMNETTSLLEDTKRKLNSSTEEQEQDVSFVVTTNATDHGTFSSYSEGSCSISRNNDNESRRMKPSAATRNTTTTMDHNYNNNNNNDNIDEEEEMDEFIIDTDNRIIPFYLSLFPSSCASELQKHNNNNNDYNNNNSIATRTSKIVHVRAKYMNILMSIVLFTVWIISCTLVALQNHHSATITTTTTKNTNHQQQQTESISTSSVVPSSSNSIVVSSSTTTTTTTSQNYDRHTTSNIDEIIDQWDVWKSNWDDNPLRMHLVTSSSSFNNFNTTPSWFSTIWNRTNQEAHAVWQNITSNVRDDKNNPIIDTKKEQQWFNTTLWNAYKFYTKLQNTTENYISNITSTAASSSNDGHNHYAILHDLFEGDTILRFWWNVTQEIHNEINGPSSSSTSPSGSIPCISFSNVTTTTITNGTNDTTTTDTTTTTTIVQQEFNSSSNGTGSSLNRTSELLPPLQQQQQQYQQQVPKLQQQQKGPVLRNKMIRAGILGTFPDEPEPLTTTTTTTGGNNNNTTTIDTTVRNLWSEIHRWVTTEFDEIREQIKTLSNNNNATSTSENRTLDHSDSLSSSSSQQDYNIYMNTTRAYAMLQNGILHKWYDYSSDYFTITLGGWDVQMNQAYCGVASATAILNSYKNTIRLPPGIVTTSPKFGNNMDSPDIEMSLYPSGRFSGGSNDNTDNVLDFQLPIDKIYEPYRYATQEQIVSVTNECVQSTVIHHNETFDGVRNVPGGLALYQVKRLLECHFDQALYGAPVGVSYHVALQYVDPHSMSIETFRDELKRALRDPLKRIIINFVRSEIHQSGGGHFSPLGSYSEEYDRFLILDVAKYKYPPVWVPTHDLYQALSTIDNCGVWDYPDAQDRILSSLNFTQKDLFNNLELYYSLLQQVGCRPTYRGYIITEIILPK